MNIFALKINKILYYNIKNEYQINSILKIKIKK